MFESEPSQVTNWQIVRDPHTTCASFAARQRERLDALIAVARDHSPFYRHLYQGLPEHVSDLHQLPPTSKPELMANFDDWTTDPLVTRASVDAFLADPALIGHDYAGGYAVWTTSGTTGRPGLFVHDRRALSVYQTLLGLRYYPAWLTPVRIRALLQGGLRTAGLFATGGHFASEDFFERIRHRSPLLATRVRGWSVLAPLPELVQALNDFRPAILASYPTALGLLAEEQIAGRLRLSPVLAFTAGERLDPATRDRISAAFSCPVADNYGATEFPYLAFACPHRSLHVNADWYIVEPVDTNNQPAPPGVVSQSVLITNLANRVQPIIRYNLGDSITVTPDACPCGSRLPVIEVVGRSSDVLVFASPDGAPIRLLPLALATVIEGTPGVHRFQAIKTAPARLALRLEAATGAAEEQVWTALEARLRTYLAGQGLPTIQVARDTEAPRSDPHSGKFRQIWSQV